MASEKSWGQVFNRYALPPRLDTTACDAPQKQAHLGRVAVSPKSLQTPCRGRDADFAAIALVNDLTMVMSNSADFFGTRVRQQNPLLAA